MFEYKLKQEVVNYLIKILDQTQFKGTQEAQDLLSVIGILQNPLNKDEMEKKQYQKLKEKYQEKSIEKNKK